VLLWPLSVIQDATGKDEASTSETLLKCRRVMCSKNHNMLHVVPNVITVGPSDIRII
jgi:hypothetical protein